MAKGYKKITNIAQLFKPYIVTRKKGQCQVLIPLVELDELCEKIEKWIAINRQGCVSCKAARFVNHIQQHLQLGEVVVCKICGKTIDDIADIKEERKDHEQAVL